MACSCKVKISLFTDLPKNLIMIQCILAATFVTKGSEKKSHICVAFFVSNT